MDVKGLRGASLVATALAALCGQLAFAYPGSQESPGAAEQDVAAVRGVFLGYKSALIAGDGKTAASLVDEATDTYFERLRDLALHGNEQEVKAHSFVERLLVLSMRQVLDRTTIESMSLADLIDVAMSEGWIAPQTLSQLDIGAIEVHGDEASAEVLSGLISSAASSDDEAPAGGTSEPGEPELRYRFVREHGAWRFRFSSLVESLDRLVEDLTSQLGTQQDDLIFMLIEGFTGRQVLPDVWEAPVD